MTSPNPNTLWARTLVDELVAQGVTAACVAPGSRSTPLTLAFDRHQEVRVFSHLDERSAGFFALGRAKRTGEPTPLVCTSGTAAANFHPAVIEADRARVPMLLLTADRPPELHDSGANQTIDQRGIYGDATRWERTLPEPRDDDRTLRMLRTTAARALAESTGVPAGPVHLNLPFRKPLEPTGSPAEEPTDAGSGGGAPAGRRGAVSVSRGSTALEAGTLESVASAVREADRGLIIAGPTDGPAPAQDALADLAAATGFPVLADPLSDLRFGPHVDDTAVLGGYDGYLDPEVTAEWPSPDVVLRFGASPTSKALREYLAREQPRQFLVDPAGGWREATFSATDLLVADPTRLARDLAERVEPSSTGWADRLTDVERRYWTMLAEEGTPPEAAVLRRVVEGAPDPATIFVSNSTPVRDLDRFCPPGRRDLRVLGNRGASGIDGITSTALGAGSATDDPLLLVTGDLAYYHDMNGLLAVQRCDVEATVVVINNDGGGIFHRLPIADHDAFEEQFVTPHGLDFEPTGDLYDLRFRRVDGVNDLDAAYREALDGDGSHVIEVSTDAAASQDIRDSLVERTTEVLL